MKQKLKQFTKFMGVCALLVLGSCEKDLYDDGIIKNDNIIVKNVSLKDLSKIDNEKLFQAVEKLRPNKENLSGKIVYDSINNFYFDDENGKLIEKEDGYKSFTFTIYNNVDNKIENVIFSKNSLGEYETYRVKYSFTAEELKLFTEVQLNQQTAFYTDITEGRQNIVCIDFLTWQSYPTEQGELTGEFGTTGQWVLTSSFCSNAADNTGGNDNGGIDLDNGTGGTGIGGTSGGILTTPIGCVGCGTSNNNNNPCNNLKRKLSPTGANLKPTIQTLQSTLNQPGENGATLHKGTNNDFQPPQSVPPSATLGLALDTGGTIYGTIHTHPWTGTPMFSFQDIYHLFTLYQNCLTVNESEVTVMLVVEYSPGVYETYALTIVDYDLFADTLNNELTSVPNVTNNEDAIKAIDIDLGDLYEHNTNYERTFLNRFTGFGISLFKADHDLTKWDELTCDQPDQLHPNPTVQKKPCN